MSELKRIVDRRMPERSASRGLLAAFCLCNFAAGAAAQPADFSAEAARKFADLALGCVHREYPNKISHVLQSDEDARPPRSLTPAFYGCLDWHSAVHGHWLLVRLARTYPQSDFAAAARAAVAESLRPERIAIEVEYFEGEGRGSFERPYGLAWLLQLASELREWDDPEARKWAAALRPLEEIAAQRIKNWLPKLDYAIRVGEHSQTAFAFGLIWDWQRVSDDEEMRRLLEERIRLFHLGDEHCPIAYEPSGQDFLSPCIAEADLMRRVLEPAVYSQWLTRFLPGIPTDGSTWIDPAKVSDRSDPKLAHLDGLNLSRAWMLEGMAAGLPADDGRRESIATTADRHRRDALDALTGEFYEGGHWLGSFATYLVTGRGL